MNDGDYKLTVVNVDVSID